MISFMNDYSYEEYFEALKPQGYNPNNFDPNTGNVTARQTYSAHTEVWGIPEAMVS